MRQLLALFTAALPIVLLLRLATGNADPAAGVTLLIVLLAGFATIDWLVTRHLAVVSPVRVYLLLVTAGLLTAWGVYLFAQLGPLLAFGLAAALGLTLLVASHLRRPHTRRAREAAGLCTECGYDLRASTDRCPECNAPLPESTTRRRRIADEIRAARGIPPSSPPAAPGG
jgi:hypothetical protein